MFHFVVLLTQVKDPSIGETETENIARGGTDRTGGEMFIRIQAGNGFADAGENGTRRGITSDTCRHQCGKLLGFYYHK